MSAWHQVWTDYELTESYFRARSSGCRQGLNTKYLAGATELESAASAVAGAAL
jgi:hypothetical protein